MQFSDESNICTIKWFKQKLLNHYGEDILITSSFGHEDIICFRDSAFSILRKRWTEEIDAQTNDEVILDMAAGIIRDKIRLMNCDTSTYPSFSQRHEDKIIPKELNRFLHSLIRSKSDDQLCSLSLLP